MPFLRGDGIMCEMGPNQNSAGCENEKGSERSAEESHNDVPARGDSAKVLEDAPRPVRASQPVKDSGKGVRISGDCL